MTKIDEVYIVVAEGCSYNENWFEVAETDLGAFLNKEDADIVADELMRKSYERNFNQAKKKAENDLASYEENLKRYNVLKEAGLMNTGGFSREYPPYKPKEFEFPAYEEWVDEQHNKGWDCKWYTVVTLPVHG